MLLGHRGRELHVAGPPVENAPSTKFLKFQEFAGKIMDLSSLDQRREILLALRALALSDSNVGFLAHLQY